MSVSPPQVVVADTAGHVDFLRNSIKMFLISDTAIVTVPAYEPYFNAVNMQLDTNFFSLLHTLPASAQVIVAVTYVRTHCLDVVCVCVCACVRA